MKILRFLLKKKTKQVDQHKKPKGCRDKDYPNDCKYAGCLYCEKYNTFYA